MQRKGKVSHLMVNFYPIKMCVGGGGGVAV
jgi:hypothetical protein